MQRRSQYFATILYPDSAPTDWKRRIEKTLIKCFVSPLHNEDPDPDTPFEDKPHWHIMLMYESLKSLDQVFDDVEIISGIRPKYVEIIKNPVGYALYLKHLRQPHKQQFPNEDVLCFNGADYEDFCNDQQRFLENLEAMSDYILANNITSFYKLVAYARYNNREWFKIISTRSTVYIRSLISSLAEEKKEMEKKLQK